MRSDKLQGLSKLTTRQKVTGGILVVVVLVILWQVVGLFGDSSTASVAPTPTPAHGGPMAAAPQNTPQAAQLPKQEGASQRELELVKLQQDTQAKYLEALNELQMLRVTREIAEANQAISTAKLNSITAQKKIVDLLVTPEPQVMPTDYARSLVAPVSSGATVRPTNMPTTLPPTSMQPEVNYTAISVSQLQNKWNAVLGYQGTLYNVMVGDVLPADGSKVVSIDKSGVVLEKDGAKKKISLVPII